MRPALLAVLALGGLASFGCASAASRGVATAAARFQRDLGTATLRDVERQVPRVLNRHQYEIERSDESPSLLTIETRWNPRYPFPDELERGVVQARTRLTLTARARARTGGAADIRVVELLAENMVQIGDSATWQAEFMTPMFAQYLDGIAEELRTELQTGIRVH